MINSIKGPIVGIEKLTPSGKRIVEFFVTAQELIGLYALVGSDLKEALASADDDEELECFAELQRRLCAIVGGIAIQVGRRKELLARQKREEQERVNSVC